jgi:RimJ/RimL family protein N-acetyltransferase
METLAPPTPQAFSLQTPRLRLREFAPGDEPALQRMHQDPRLRAQLIDDAPLERPSAAALFVQRIAAVYRTRRGLGIWHASTGSGEFAGWFSLMPLDGHAGEVELGSRLLPRHWGSGLALDGGEALLTHAFGSLGLPRVWGLCHPANRGARLCLAALGFGEGVMAACSSAASGQALHHVVDGPRFQRARAQPRRQRLQRAAQMLRELADRELTTKVNA